MEYGGEKARKTWLRYINILWIGLTGVKRKLTIPFTPWFTEKYQKGDSFGTLNTCRAAISLLCGEHIGRSLLISRILRGVAKMRPAKPKYDSIHSLDLIISRLESMAPLETLTLQQLTSKLAMLLALVTAHRKQTLIASRRSNIHIVENGYEIEIPSRIKTTRAGSYQPLLLLSRFTDKPNLCVASTLEIYLERTSLLLETDSLFITTRKPHKAASKDTLSRWIRAFLLECGTSLKYAPHSVRHAATSSAQAKGVELSIIKKLASWSSTSKVFKIFYNRPIIKDRTAFAQAVLG